MEIQGSCECGKVAFEVTGTLSPVVACHLTQCRKTSGHYWAATEVQNTHLRLIKDSGLRWYRSSDQARRGFCVGCGSSLFWEADGEGTTTIGSGTFDELRKGIATLVEHIFAADKGTYCEVEDGLPQSAGW